MASSETDTIPLLGKMSTSGTSKLSLSKRMLFQVGVPREEFTIIQQLAGAIQMFFKNNNIQFQNVQFIGGKPLEWITRMCEKELPSVDYDFHVILQDNNDSSIFHVIRTLISKRKNKETNTINMNGVVFELMCCAVDIERKTFIIKLKKEIDGREYCIDISRPWNLDIDFCVNMIGINMTLGEEPNVIIGNGCMRSLISLIQGKPQTCLFLFDMLANGTYSRQTLVLDTAIQREKYVRNVFRLHKMNKKFPIKNLAEYMGDCEGCPVCRMTSNDWSSLSPDQQILYKMHLRFECSHTICFMCNAKMIQSNNRSCPLCRQPCRVNQFDCRVGNKKLDNEEWELVDEHLPGFHWFLSDFMTRPLIVDTVDETVEERVQAEPSINGLMDALDSELGPIVQSNIEIADLPRNVHLFNS